MAKKEGATLPSGQGGLVQYFDSDSGIEIDPKTVIGLCVGVAVVEIALHMRIIGL